MVWVKISIKKPFTFRSFATLDTTSTEKSIITKNSTKPAKPACKIKVFLVVPIIPLSPFSTFQNCEIHPVMFSDKFSYPGFSGSVGRILFPITRGRKSILNIRPSLIFILCHKLCPTFFCIHIHASEFVHFKWFSILSRSVSVRRRSDPEGLI